VTFASLHLPLCVETPPAGERGARDLVLGAVDIERAELLALADAP